MRWINKIQKVLGILLSIPNKYRVLVLEDRASRDFREGRTEDAIRKIAEASHLTELYPRHYLQMGMYFITLGQFKNAVILFPEMIKSRRYLRRKPEERDLIMEKVIEIYARCEIPIPDELQKEIDNLSMLANGESVSNKREALLLSGVPTFRD